MWLRVAMVFNILGSCDGGVESDAVEVAHINGIEYTLRVDGVDHLFVTLHETAHIIFLLELPLIIELLFLMFVFIDGQNYLVVSGK